MPERSIRFGITDGAGKRSATWKCWTRTGTGKHDIYLACRALGGALKTSLHETGQWRTAYLKSFFDEKVVDPEHKKKGRVVEEWPRPKEIAPGTTLAFRVVTPWSAVRTPYDEKDKDFRHMHWIQNANEGKATEIDIIITDPTTPVAGWPGKNSMNTCLVGSTKLECGETVWVVYWEIEMPTLPSRKATPRFYKGKSKDDLEGENMRIVVFGAEEDGSRVMYDCAFELEGK